PYGRAVSGEVTPDDSLATLTDEGERNAGDSAPYMPRSVVVTDDPFDWGDDRRPHVPWDRTVIYEAHVRGMTMRHPDVPDHLRGTFAGFGHAAVTGYLIDLGVTSIELLPVQHFISEPALAERGLVNYWGYNTIGFFAPHAGYSSADTTGGQITEFKEFVKALHAAGLEVILDVVYNHTAEAGRTGPTLSFRGIDDAAYYRQDSHGNYRDFTGCGNTLNVSHPQTLRLVMDSLRYWVQEMHVDGFRFDLASALIRNDGQPDLRHPFLKAIHQDPLLRQVKLIAEPWDATGEGYLVGRFPTPWSEWNDKYRDGVRDYWRAHGGGLRELGRRLSGSSDIYAGHGRQPHSSVNFVTAHDGFTLRDAVSYDHKHNSANGEDGRDGLDHNRSWNHGGEGPTDDEAICALRRRQAANLMATLLLSSGVPMITAGDERGRTQGGNNNAFCQDNELSWLDWELDADWQHLHALTKQLLALRAEHPVLRRHHFFTGVAPHGPGRKDISWLEPSGEEMTEADWRDPAAATLGVFLSGDKLVADGGGGPGGPDDDTDARGESSYLIWMHAGADPVDVTLPEGGVGWYFEILRTDAAANPSPALPGTTVTLLGRTVAVYEAV
ncbi:MAG: glycogen debranching protein GlgX, partial [Nocardioidaceae bacterium]|nr:glycogen debranching protein GlgX [Nocardioidaceae bacterium]